jgi:hypothetical protein
MTAKQASRKSARLLANLQTARDCANNDLLGADERGWVVNRLAEARLVRASTLEGDPARILAEQAEAAIVAWLARKGPADVGGMPSATWANCQASD